MNYYDILSVSTTAVNSEICDAYRTLSLKWHPEKTSHDTVNAWHKFHQLAEAYEVLSNPTYREQYNSLGLFSFKEGVSDKGNSFNGGYSYHGNPLEIFSKFFGTNNPFEEAYGEAGKIERLFGAGLRGPEELGVTRPEDLEVEVPTTLAELYMGCSKTVKYTRRVLNSNNNEYSEVQGEKTIEIKPGFPTGGSLIFPSEGHDSAVFPSSNLVLLIRETTHEFFQRDGDNLVYTAKLNLLSALTGRPVTIVSSS